MNWLQWTFVGWFIGNAYGRWIGHVKGWTDHRVFTEDQRLYWAGKREKPPVAKGVWSK